MLHVQNDNKSFLNTSKLSLTRSEGEETWSPNGSNTEQIGLTCGYIIVIITGLIGNSLVIRAVKTNRSMHTPTNYLLANIALADLITMVSCLPFVILKYFSHPEGMIGTLVCTFVTKNNFSSITLSVSVQSLCILAIERYHALIKPMQSGLRMSKGTVSYAVIATWVLAVIASLPLLIFTEFNEEKRYCQFTFKSHIYWIAVGAMTFLFLITICYCYFKVLQEIHSNKILSTRRHAPPHTNNETTQSKRKLVKLLLTLTCVFMLFFAPRVVYLFSSPFLSRTINRSSFRRVTFFLVVCHSCVNPIICAFQSDNYRKAFKAMLRLQRQPAQVEPSRDFSRRKQSTRNEQETQL